MINEGKLEAPKRREDIPVLVGLEGEDGFPHQGKLDFVNNALVTHTNDEPFFLYMPFGSAHSVRRPANTRQFADRRGARRVHTDAPR